MSVEARLQVKIRGDSVSVVQVNYAWDKTLTEPDALLDRYTTLTGWGEALLGAGAARSAVIQRFHRDARVTRNGVDYVFCAGRMADAVAERRPDLAHVNGLEFPLETWRLRRRLRRSAAIVVQSHVSGAPLGRAPLLRPAGRLTRGAVDAFLFAADEHAAVWRDAGMIGPSQRTWSVMEASTTLRPIARDAARAESAIAGDPAVLWVGRLNPNKDPLTVLAGFERALRHLPDATLTMSYGTGELLPDVRARIAQSPLLTARVRLAGALPHDRMANYFSAADLYVSGSHHEGSGYALMEAMACGAVPVVTDIPTFRLLTGDALGARWTPGDAAGCARAFVAAARRDLAAERARVRERFERELSWPAVGRRALEIYREVISIYFP